MSRQQLANASLSEPAPTLRVLTSLAVVPRDFATTSDVIWISGDIGLLPTWAKLTDSETCMVITNISAGERYGPAWVPCPSHHPNRSVRISMERSSYKLDLKNMLKTPSPVIHLSPNHPITHPFEGLGSTIAISPSINFRYTTLSGRGSAVRKHLSLGTRVDAHDRSSTFS